MKLPIARLTGAAFIAVAAELAGIALTATAAWLIVRAAEQPPIAALTVAIVIVRTLAIARGGLRYAERLAGHSAVLRTMADLRGRVYTALLRRKDIREGDALTRVVSDVDELQDSILRCAVPAAVAAVVGVIGLAVTAVVSLPAAAALAIGLAITAFVLPFAAKRLAERTARQTVKARTQLADHMVDLVHGAPELEIYGARERKLSEADAVAADIAATERRSGTTVLTAIGMTVQTGTVLAIITLAAPGPVTAAVALGVLAGMETFLPLTAAAARWASARPAIDRIKDLLTGPAKAERPAPEVELRGKHTGVVGPSGAGKSTLLAAIAREEPQARGAMADAHIFNATIRENLVFAKPESTEADLDTVAKLVRLDEWLRSLPDGWDTRITGETVSGGQRQRLILARALLTDAPILLLDEPVEGLETQQADEILADVLATAAGKAVVLVTHRLTQLAWFDDIVVLDKGKVIQRGSHADLVSQPGYYRGAWEAEQLHN